MQTVRTTRGEQRAVWFDEVTAEMMPWATRVYDGNERVGRIQRLRGTTVLIIERIILDALPEIPPTILYEVTERPVDPTILHEMRRGWGGPHLHGGIYDTYRAATEGAVRIADAAERDAAERWR